jgi:hypothetical protein
MYKGFIRASQEEEMFFILLLRSAVGGNPDAIQNTCTVVIPRVKVLKP